MKTAVIYTRVSTEDQNTSRQVNELREYASANGIEISGEFSDTISGGVAADDRPSFSKMIDHMKANQIKLILVSEFSRIGRDEVDTLLLIRKFIEMGVAVWELTGKSFVVDESGEMNGENRLVLAIKSIFASGEREKLKSRVKSGLKDAVRKGHYITQRPLGYDVKDSKLILNAEAAKTVKRIYEVFLQTRKLYATTKIINNEGHKSLKGKNFHNNKIKHILENPIYTGVWEYKGIKIDVPQIIDKSIFDQVQAILSNREFLQRDKGRKHINPFNEIEFVCGNCGKSVHPYYVGYSPQLWCRTQQTSYQTGNGKENGCFRFPIENFMNVIIDMALKANEGGQYLAGAVEKIKNEIEEIKIDISAKQGQINTLQRRMKKDLELFYGDVLKIDQLKSNNIENEAKINLLNDDISVLNKRIAGLERRRLKLNNPTFAAENIGQDLETFRQFITANIYRITVTVPPQKVIDQFKSTVWGNSLTKVIRIDVDATLFQQTVYATTRKNIYADVNETPIKLDIDGKTVTIIESNPFELATIKEFKKVLTIDKETVTHSKRT